MCGGVWDEMVFEYSLGVGALAMLKSDSVYRFGHTKTADFRIIKEEPVRSITETNCEAALQIGNEYI